MKDMETTDSWKGIMPKVKEGEILVSACNAYAHGKIGQVAVIFYDGVNTCVLVIGDHSLAPHRDFHRLKWTKVIPFTVQMHERFKLLLQRERTLFIPREFSASNHLIEAICHDIVLGYEHLYTFARFGTPPWNVLKNIGWLNDQARYIDGKFLVSGPNQATIFKSGVEEKEIVVNEVGEYVCRGTCTFIIPPTMRLQLSDSPYHIETLPCAWILGERKAGRVVLVDRAAATELKCYASSGEPYRPGERLQIQCPSCKTDHYAYLHYGCVCACGVFLATGPSSLYDTCGVWLNEGSYWYMSAPSERR